MKAGRLNDTAEDFLECAEAIVGAVRTSGRPHFLVIDTARLGAHSKGDDLRPREEIDRIKARDPLRALRARLPQSVAETTERDNEAFIRGCSASVLGRSYARASIQDVKTPPKPRLFPSKPAPITFRESLNAALGRLLSADPKVILLGEDLHAPYGGAFKVTAGLPTPFQGAFFPPRSARRPSQERRPGLRWRDSSRSRKSCLQISSPYVSTKS